MSIRELVLGIDAGADTIALCLMDRSGTVIRETSGTADIATVAAHLEGIGSVIDTAIGIESGGYGIPLIRALRTQGYQVRVLEARRVSGFLKLTQNKTDRNDARGIAEIIRLGSDTIPHVLVKQEAVQMLRSDIVLRHRMMMQRIALENAVRGTFRLNGGKLARPFSGAQLDRHVDEELVRLRELGRDLFDTIKPVTSVLVTLRQTLERSDRRLARIANELEACRLFMTIPGVGCICALSFYTAVENPHRFEDNGDIGPYLGLVPKIMQSGTVFRSGRISRMGNTMTRTHLVTAATSMMMQAQKDSDIRRWAMALAERAGRGKARVALARKLATVMLAMWKTGQPFRRDR